jgi:uncharacterized protein DUF3830
MANGRDKFDGATGLPYSIGVFLPTAAWSDPMSTLRIIVGSMIYTARMEEQDAPQTCAAFRMLLPYRRKIIHARWSGEACWVPLGDFALGVGYENHTSHPAPGEILWYPGGYSETEILFPYGAACFASKLGQLAGNHFLTIVEGREQMREMGHKVLWEGAQEIVFELMGV